MDTNLNASNAAYEPSRVDIAKGILEGWCVRHGVALVPAEGGWSHCPRSSGGLARAYMNGPEVVVQIRDVLGEHIVMLGEPNEV